MIDFDQLEEDLRAERVEMDSRKKAQLHQRLREQAAPRPARARRPLRWLLAPASGLAVAMVVALLVVVLPRGGDDGDGASSAESGASVVSAAPEAAAPSAGVAAPPAASRAGGGRRFVERTTSLSLSTPADDLRDVANGIVRETKDAGGVVDASSVSASGDGGTASFTLRIPSDRLAGAVKALSGLGDVVSLDEATQDITGSVASASERLSEARAERRGILRSLQRANSDAELAALRARLREVRARIGRADGDLQALRRRADLARVQVEVSAAGKPRHDGGGAGWTPGDAAGDAWRILQVVAGVVLVAAAVLAPLALLALLAVATTRLTRRRRREHALDSV